MAERKEREGWHQPSRSRIWICASMGFGISEEL
jgi:hypothetical protein